MREERGRTDEPKQARGGANHCCAKEVSEAEEVKHLRDEIARLKKFVAELSLDKNMLQSVIRKTPGALSAAIGSALAGKVQVQRERHVCELMAVPGSSGRYQSRRDDSQVQERRRELARKHPRLGYRRLYLYLHEETGVNHKKVQRVYRELGLSVKRTRRQASAAQLRAAAPQQRGWGDSGIHDKSVLIPSTGHGERPM